jgi:hypothetical protein
VKLRCKTCGENPAPDLPVTEGLTHWAGVCTHCGKWGEQQADPDLAMYVVYRYPTDYPHEWVCRIHRIRPSGETEAEAEPFAVATTLGELREKLPRGLYRIDRHPQDVLAIVETWL